MIITYNRPQSAVAAVHASAAPTSQNSTDELLVERIAAGDKLAMQVLFSRHRTLVHRWLLRFVRNEALAERRAALDLWGAHVGRVLTGISRECRIGLKKSSHSGCGPI
jgi:hypothetical protein